MKKIIIAAFLATAAMPANAFTYVVYNASGSGSTLDSFTGWQSGIAHVQLIVPLDNQSPIWDYYNMFFWTRSGDQVKVSAGMQAESQVTLKFDHSLTAFPLTSEGFVSGSATVKLGSYKTLYGSLNTLTVSTITSDKYLGSLTGWLEIPGVPEPASWAMMIGGFALAGAAMRRRPAKVRFAIA